MSRRRNQRSVNNRQTERALFLQRSFCLSSLAKGESKRNIKTQFPIFQSLRSRWQQTKHSKVDCTAACFFVNAVTNFSSTLIRSTSRPNRCNTLHNNIFIFSYPPVFIGEARVSIACIRSGYKGVYPPVAQTVYHPFFLCQGGTDTFFCVFPKKFYSRRNETVVKSK